jgi:hypothetical protein
VNREACLVYASGLPYLDIHELYDGLGQELRNGGEVMAVARSGVDEYSILWYSGEHPEMSLDGYGMKGIRPKLQDATLEEVIRTAKLCGVTWVLPTAHCSETTDLAFIAQGIGANYPSPIAVDTIEYKPSFYRALSEVGAPVPETAVCTDEPSIMRAVAGLGGPGILKTDAGHSSLGLRTFEGRGPLTAADEAAIREHIAIRNAKGLGESVLQALVGDEEYGFQAMIEVSDKGIDFVWYATTRKIVLARLGRLIAHIYDPRDQRRIALTEELFLPTIRRGLEALLQDEVERLPRRVGRYALNADLRTDGTTAWWIDGSYRWAPLFKQICAATIGLPACHTRSEEYARAWAQGHPIDRDNLKPGRFGPQRAVLLRKAYATRGGTLIQHSPAHAEDEAFYVQIPRVGTVMPGPQEVGLRADIEAYPLLGVCGENRSAVEESYRRELRRTGLASRLGEQIHTADSEPSLDELCALR